MKSIIQKDESRCFICGKNGGYWGLDTHHVFFGALRKKSEKYGLTVRLCHLECHLEGVHKDRELDLKLKRIAQKKAMKKYNLTTEEFIELFGQNYLERD